MAAPSFVSSGTGATDAQGAWTYSGAASVAGNVVILQILQDGTTGGAVTLTSATNIENLAGTDNAWTSIGTFNCGSPTGALQHLWIGRLINTSAPTASGGNSTSEDLYMRTYTYSSVNTGTTLADVIENSTAGSTANGTGTSATVSDTGVTTLGADRLALNFYAANDDVVGGEFSGESGGDWGSAFSVQQYAEASGTDGALQMHGANMAAAGTVNGGSVILGASVAWGVVGFALIGTTPSTRQPRHGFVNHQNPGVLMERLGARWRRRRTGIFIPDFSPTPA